jgi:hypothetical protein
VDVQLFFGLRIGLGRKAGTDSFAPGKLFICRIHNRISVNVGDVPLHYFK